MLCNFVDTIIVDKMTDHPYPPQTDPMAVYAGLTSPAYVIEEPLLRRNLALIADVARRAEVEIILAFKAFALWKTFPIFREYIHSTTASSLNEARLAFEEFGAPAHTYSPAYTDGEIGEIARCSSHLTFNSLGQLSRLGDAALAANPALRLGLRINPEYSEVETELYNPCAPGTRFGVMAEDLPEQLPASVSGFHCHCHCESGADVFERTLSHIEQRFAPWFPQLSWINFGGGHLMTRADYDVDRLVCLLQGFHARYPHLHVVLEPGSAFGWQTGPLVAQVVDVVENRGIRTAIVNVSFTCHMPDCLEMPYHPTIIGATTLADGDEAGQETQPCVYRIGGNSCLSGDFMGYWKFPQPLVVGDEIVFDDMIHYTTVKTNMFNGIHHPALVFHRCDCSYEVLRQYTYADYRDRMD